MLEKLKGFISTVMERGIVDSLPSRFMNIIDDFDDDVIHEGFMTEVRELVKSGTIKYIIEDAEGACYYLFRIDTGDVDYNTFTILYKSHENSDVAWIFGFPNNLVLCSEYDINNNDDKNEIVIHEGSYRAYDWDDRFITLMSGYFMSLELDIL